MIRTRRIAILAPPVPRVAATALAIGALLIAGHAHAGGHGKHLAKPAKPSLHLGVLNVIGAIDKSVVRGMVKAHGRELLDCYLAELKKTPGLKGTVAAQFFVGPDGKVAHSEAHGVSPEVSTCIATVLGALVFPAPGDGGGTQVNYPFTLRDTSG